LAIEMGLLQAEHPAADAFVTWFYELFPLDPAE
jgi:hypothetical protein